MTKGEGVAMSGPEVRSAARVSRQARTSAQRWWVHVSLIGTALVSLAFEGIVLFVHIVVGLLFVLLVGVHLGQRRRTSLTLARQLPRLRVLERRAGRLAFADAGLLVVTAAMFASGMWDWLTGHPTRIRWHALTGVALALLLLVHTVRRRSRLRRSRIR